MKVLNIHKIITPGQLLNLLQQKLNPVFRQRRQKDISFSFENTENGIEILQRELYAGFLFRIAIRGDELLITRASDYIDDINALTIESILNEIFADLAGGGNVTLELEG